MKTSKRILAALLAALTLFSLTACASRQTQTAAPVQSTTTQQPAQQETPAQTTQQQETPAQDTEPSADTAAPETPVQPEEPEPIEPADEQPEETPAEGGKTLVVYFSATGSTAAVAGYIADALGADTLELVPQEPYTADDLDWRAADSRVNREHDDESLRDIALTETTPDNWDEYDTVFIGYPIWWGIAAWPVNNFVKNNDFTGKTVIPFCTSSSSGLGQSGTLLEQMANGGTWQSGQRFSSNAAADTVRDWAADLGL